MNRLLTVGTVTMTRNVGAHLLITLALSAAAAAVAGDPELPSGNEITLLAPLGTAIPNGTTVAVQLGDAPVAEAADAQAQLEALQKHLSDAKTAHTSDLASAQQQIDEVRAFYEKELTTQKSQVDDHQKQLAEALAELGAVRAALAGSPPAKDVQTSPTSPSDPPAAPPSTTEAPEAGPIAASPAN